MEQIPEYYLNVGLFAQVDAGKTTTTEQILYHTGTIREAGNIEDGDTRTDNLEIEKKRGISVLSSEVSVTIGDTLVNLIDTPGHTDFAGETERCLSVPEGAVIIISASDGVSGRTERLFEAIQKKKLPCLFFLNKTDTLKSDTKEILSVIRERLTKEVYPLTEAIGEGSSEVRIAEHVFSDEELALLCEKDDKLADRYISGEPISREEILSLLARQTKIGEAYPLLTGAAALGKGIDDLIRAMTRFLPKHKPMPDGEPSGFIYQIRHDPRMGKIAYVKLEKGTLHSRDALTLIKSDGSTVDGKITQIRKSFGAKTIDRGFVQGGDTSALAGISEAKIGDVFGRGPLEATQLSSPLFKVRVFCEPEKQAQLLKAAEELTDEDPLLDCEWIPETSELNLKVMGKVQPEILSFLFKERYDLDVRFSDPSVIYKETPAKSGYGFEAYTMPKPCWAILKLKLEPLPRGSGYQFESIVPTEKLFIRYQNHIRACLPQTMKQGRLGWEVTDLKITLVDGEHHLVHTHPLDFFLATPIAFQDGMRNCGSTLLEPCLKLSLVADEALAGRLIGDMIAMRAEFESPVIKSGRVYLEATVPVATSMDYAADFASLTSGRGLYSASFAGYRDCPLELGKTCPRKGIDPLDRAKWILYKRGAIQDSIS